MQTTSDRGSSSGSERFTLGSGLLKRHHLVALLVGVVLLTMVPLGVILYQMSTSHPSMGSFSEFLEHLWAEMAKAEDPLLAFWAGVVVVPLGVMYTLLQSKAWLRVDDIGIELNVPKWLGLRWFKQTVGYRRIHWGEIRSVRWAPLPGRLPALQRLGNTRLIIDTGREEVWVAPYVWLSRTRPDHRLGLRDIAFFTRFDAEYRRSQAPLMQLLETRGIKPGADTEEDDESQAAGFDLRSHRGMLWQIVVFFCAGIYALIDGLFIGQFRPLEALPSEPFIVMAAVAGVWVVRSGKSAPKVERTVLGVMTVAVLIVAVYPGLLRVNAVTGNTQQLEYVASTRGHFLPPDAKWPELHLQDLDINEYWEAYPQGTPHPFTIQRGIGGFPQLDLRPLYERTRALYICFDS